MSLIPKPDVTIRWAEGGNQLEPASEVQELGFVVEKPPYEVVNWLHNKHDTAIAYLYQEGFPDWDIETEYSNTSYVKYDDVVYKSNLQNTGKQPDVNPDTWEVAFANQQDFLDLYQDLQDTKNVAGYAGNLVYKDSPVMTGKAVGTSFSSNSGIGTNDGYQFNAHGRDGLFHNGVNPVVLNDGTTVASFSGNINTPSAKDVVTFDLLQKYLEIYKVGDIYITTTQGNPSTTLGYGTWVRYGEGRVIVGFSETSSHPDWTKVLNNTFGGYTHTLTVSELASHKHSVAPFDKFTSRAADSGKETQGSGDYDRRNDEYSTGAMGTVDWQTATEKAAGGNQPHNNVQPSIVTFVWRRVS